MTKLPPAPDLLPQAGVRAQRAQLGGRPTERLQVAELRGRDRHRHRQDHAQHLPRRGRRLHPRLHHRQRLRAARLPRHRLRLDAAGQGRRHAVPARAGPGRGLGLPRQADPHARQRRGPPGRQHRRDEVGHALPRRRHRPHDHPAARRRPAVRHTGDLPHRLSGRRRRGRGRGPRDAAQPHRRRADARSAPTWAPNRPRARRCSPRRRAATGSSAASASPTLRHA